jgi:hypothetical protein
MRDTPYAKEIKRAVVSFPDGSEGRIERLLIKESQQVAMVPGLQAK